MLQVWLYIVIYIYIYIYILSLFIDVDDATGVVMLIFGSSVRIVKYMCTCLNKIYIARLLIINDNSSSITYWKGIYLHYFR